MTLEQYLNQLQKHPEQVEFAALIELIDSLYDFTPTEFSNADLINRAGENNGSCKLFAFGQLHRLNADKMLACFGDYYRYDVLQNPSHDNHQNIRQFIKTGWGGIQYSGTALTLKKL